MNRCLAPQGNCSEHAISAHTVQNARVLELLQIDGHVKTFKQGLDPDGKLVLQIEDVGRNKATTFEGFCGRHDRELFLPIDTQALDVQSPGQLFLLAYRAVAREVHAQMSGAMRLQMGYQKGVADGRFPKDVPSEPGLLAIRHMLIAHQGYLYKHDLDEALLKKDYSVLTHRVMEIPRTAPSVATAACFTVPHWTRGVARVSLNLLPISATDSVAIFSYTSDHAEAVNSMLDRVFGASGVLLKYLLSKLILARCENMVIAPETFQGWTQDQIAAMKDFFSKTTSDYFDIEDPRLYLFRDY